MKRLIIVMALCVVASVMSACGGATSVPAGAFRFGGSEVTLGREWSDVSGSIVPRPKKVRLLSIDGPRLNRLYISDGLAVGDYLVKPLAKEQPTPTIRAGMSANERMEFVSDSIAAMDFQRVQIVKPRPAKFGEHAAIRFDIEAKTKEGLDILGTAEVAEVAGKTHVLIYLAPAEHYYAATLAEVETIIASARPKG